MAWFAQSHRPLPWKGEKDPYKIWLSEIILQQTRVEQGLPYFEKFVQKYPTVRDLAAAPEDEVLKLWQGLGYYSRARNLHLTAKFIALELGGKFPNTFGEIKKLKGVGDYTAAAIASFAFDLPTAVVDGNVFRVLARFFGIETPTDLPAAKKEFSALANRLILKDRPGDFNQAMMDFGATHCLPKKPKCPSCPLRPNCFAHLYNKASELPVRGKALTKKERIFIYLVFKIGDETFIRKREGKDIWQNLYEFPMLEIGNWKFENSKLGNKQPEIRKLKSEIRNQIFPGEEFDFEILAVSKTYRQVLSHQNVSAVFCEIEYPTNDLPLVFTEKHIRTSRIQMEKMYAVPKIVERYLKENALHLTLF